MGKCANMITDRCCDIETLLLVTNGGLNMHVCGCLHEYKWGSPWKISLGSAQTGFKLRVMIKLPYNVLCSLLTNCTSSGHYKLLLYYTLVVINNISSGTERRLGTFVQLAVHSSLLISNLVSFYGSHEAFQRKYLSVLHTLFRKIVISTLRDDFTRIAGSASALMKTSTRAEREKLSSTRDGNVKRRLNQRPAQSLCSSLSSGGNSLAPCMCKTNTAASWSCVLGAGEGCVNSLVIPAPPCES